MSDTDKTAPTEEKPQEETKETKETKPVEAEEPKPENGKDNQEEAGNGAVSVEVEEKLKTKIVEQLEYYFGDVNLPRDTFMKGEMAKNDGWIEVTTMLKFNRLKSLLDGVFEEKQHVAAILDCLQSSDLIEVDPAGKKLRRSLEFPAPESRAEDKTVYLKNFPKTETTLDELLEHFKSNYEGVQGVIMRNFNRKTFEKGEIVFKREFKGSIFVVFKTKEQAESLLSQESVKYKGVELLKMMQKEYSAQKLAKFQARAEARKKKSEKVDDDDGPAEGENALPELPANIFVKILGIPEGLSREDIKSSWADFFSNNKEEYQIAFIDFNRGEKDAVLRLDRENAATEAIELISKSENPGKIGIGTGNAEKQLCEVKQLEGKEEEDHRAQVSKQQQMRLTQRKRNANRGRGRGRGHKRQRRY
ncbi:unnamed protein product [Allacma fusca]|uniref:La protein homolog n=1 Tax=Allacma fusca TaxID=39272 RepID=A0A8J2JXV6_9HEXA|nr:unnamed protein product [Allacma fusca]